MTVCRCGAETNRLHQTWEAGQVVEEYCPTCKPGAFERQQDPSEKKIWMGWEVDAAHYKREYDKDGPIMMPSDSVLQDLENAATKRPDGEPEAEQRAIKRKRENRRTTPMDAVELSQALHVAKVVAGQIEEKYAE